MNESEHADYYAVHIPSPDGGTSSNGAVFATLKEASSFANTPESKARGARFKRFQSPVDAKNYAENGDVFFKSPEATSAKQALFEPSVSFPSVSRIMLNRLKKSIETKDDKLFLDMVSQNPRYLINVGSDTPTIVVEGFRYNAMHLAAKCGNLYVAKYVLHLVCDSQALLALYDTSVEDVKMRSRFLLDCYLNMPDKGSHDTPLHFASKFGHKHLVELFLNYSVCQKNPINKMGFTPAQICCTRYSGGNKEDLQAAMAPLFSAFFTALYRPTDDYYSVTIQIFDDVPPNRLSDDGGRSPSHMPALEVCELTAYAGPFTEQAQAEEFCRLWKNEEREYRKSQPRKGAERIGRRLAKLHKVSWLEHWSFCDKLIDLQSFAGLEELNRYLVYIRLYPPTASSRNIIFDEENEDSIFKDAFESMMDTSDSKSDMAVTNESRSSSLCGITTKTTVDSNSDHLQRLAALQLDMDTSVDLELEVDDSVAKMSAKMLHVSQTNRAESPNQHELNSNNEESKYCTPPTSPEPVYIFEGIPSKDDEELAIALSLVDPQMIQHFGAIAEYLRHVRKVPETERSQWPSTDSPRAKRRKV